MAIVAAWPMAAPRMPSAGSPKRPKISAAESTTFTRLPTAATARGVLVSPAPWRAAAAMASTKASGKTGSTMCR
jgi:hypothetical protein